MATNKRETDRSSNRCDPDRPVDNVRCEDVDREGSGKVPEVFRSLDALADLEAFEVVRVDAKMLADVSDEPIEFSVPDWSDIRSRPVAALRQEGYRPRIRFRGKELQPAVVLGSDERRTYSDRSYPWGCVCKVITSVGSGSGVIIGPRHVLTASHVVNWSVPGGVNGTVEVHRAGATVSAVSPIRRVFAYTQVTGTVGWTELDEDYAVLEVADPIGDRFGWLGCRTYSSSWDGDAYWYNVGYPGDVGGAAWPTWQRSKWLNEHAWDFGSGRAMDTDADINPGNSGGPMFAWWSDGPYAVSVVSAHDVEDRENYCSGGSDIVRLVRLARGL
ncbi:trypsin-like serine peptidase [Nocardioides allogilvus]|uniref:trypsin-like serine peptidase n=1 Tax=Nocardioides allogilvus TaxID=2072017 RepID=UPI0018E50A97|nr:serine protease [Nocardioides allogilvus]